MTEKEKLKRFYKSFIRKLWDEGNRLYNTKLPYPRMKWTRLNKDDEYAGMATNWDMITLCYDYAYYFRKEMLGVAVHEVSHCFSTYFNDLMGIEERDHGYRWKFTADKLAAYVGCKAHIANHAFHYMNLSDKRIAALN